MRVAIMQPYFAPYVGYFRLFEAADLFVVYDCVQFPRRGRVHRNQLTDRLGRPQWLTLPLVKAPRDVLIRDLRIDRARFAEFLWSWRRFPAFDSAHPVLRTFMHPSVNAVDYLERTLEATTALFNVTRPMIRSSALGIAAEHRGQDRVIEIAKTVKATHYVNAPGGRALYDASTFARHGLRLEFLSEYTGARWSVLQHILTEPRTPRLCDRPPQLEPA